MSLGRWLLVACFPSVKNHNVSDLIFFQVSPHKQINPFATPRTVAEMREFDGKEPLIVERTIAISGIPTISFQLKLYSQ